MRFKLGHQDYPELSFYILAFTPDVEEQINRMGPHQIIASRLDWPVLQNNFYYGWSDSLNSLWWPRGADQFANCIIALDEYQNVLVENLVAAQVGKSKDPGTQLLYSISFEGFNKLVSGGGTSTLVSATATSTLRSGGGGPLTLGSTSVVGDDVEFTIDGGLSGSGHLVNVQATTSAGDVLTGYGTIKVSYTDGRAPEDIRPYLILQALLAPAEGASPAEEYAPAGVAAVSVETELMAWKLYPLPPVRLPKTDVTDSFGGLLLLPLVDARYFWRMGPIGTGVEGSSASGSGAGGATEGFPIIDIEDDQDPTWMPPLRAYPDDVSAPIDFDPIDGNGTQPSIVPTTMRGVASDIQAAMSGWRVTCRDVRSNYNATPITGTPHTDFTGIVSDYPDTTTVTESYHLDAIRLAGAGNVISGGLIDTTVSQSLLPRKLRILFQVTDDTAAYEILTRALVDDPSTVADIGEDANGPSAAERLHLPRAVLGVPCSSRTPGATERAGMLEGAEQWTILYYRWRRKPCFFKFPGIAPVIPSGVSGIIHWSFTSTEFFTTYVAVNSLMETEPIDSVGGTSTSSTSTGGFWARLTAKAHPLDPTADESDDGDEDNVFDATEYLKYNHTRYDFVKLTDSDSPKAITWTNATVTGHAYEVNNVNVPVNVGSFGGSSSSHSNVHLPTIVFLRKGEGDYYLFEYTPRCDFVRRTSAADGDGNFGGALLYWDQTSKTWEAHTGVLLMDVNSFS